jgi:RHS repeat-associated protein
VYFSPEIASAQDHYPFGSIMPGRSFSSDSYRFGFQGQEQDDEVKGTGNHIHFTFRGYDSRTGKMWSVDPLAPEYPWNSPYAFSENRVIDAVELEGLESFSNITWQAIHRDNPKLANNPEFRRGMLQAEGTGAAIGVAAFVGFYFGPAAVAWAVNNPVAAGEVVVELGNPSGVGLFGVGGAGIASSQLGRSSLKLGDELLDEAIELFNRVDPPFGNQTGKVFGSVDDFISGLGSGSFSYRTPSNMLDFHSHGTAEEILTILGHKNVDDFAKSFEGLSQLDAINLFTCSCGGGTFAKELAQKSKKIVGGFSTEVVIKMDGTISLPKGGEYIIRGLDGEVLDQFSPKNTQSVIDRMQEVIGTTSGK